MSELVLTPKYRVELVSKNKKHFYDVFFSDEQQKPSHTFPGTTGYLDVINKPALVGWAKRESLNHVQATLFSRLKGKDSSRITLNTGWIYELIAEAKASPDKIKDEAADLGTQAHAFIDLIIKGQEPDNIPLEILNPVLAFKEWWKSSGIELVLPDTKVASLTYGYGGSLDALGRRNGKFIILDWKTGNGIYPEYSLQVAAYAQAFYETYGIYCQEAAIARFSKKEPVTFEKKEITDLQRPFSAFLNAKALKEGLVAL